MKFNELLFDVILEEFENKKLLNFCLTKWFGNLSSDDDKDKTEELLSNYTELKKSGRLALTTLPIRTFLTRFPDFDKENITKPETFSLSQMQELTGEFFGGRNTVEDDIPQPLRGKNLKPNEERIQASKDLWYGINKYLVINEEGFRVYSIPDRSTSINFGYYEQFVSDSIPYRNMPNHMQWCTTRYEINSNLYSSYRQTQGRTFYFVIDESKDPKVEGNIEKSKYYLSALQPAKDSSTGYKLTNILNDGNDAIVTEEAMYVIYPKLRGHWDKIKPQQYDSVSELGDTDDIVQLMSEVPGSKYEFLKMYTRYKKEFIERGQLITKKTSWDLMDESLRNIYLMMTNGNNFLMRINKEIFLEIIKRKNDGTDKASYATLEHILRRDNKSFVDIITPIIKNEYVLYRVSKVNPNIAIYKTHKRPSTYGIFDATKFDWYSLNGNLYGTYDDNLPYREPRTTLFKGTNSVRYIVETFSKSSEPDKDSFVSIYSTSDNEVKGYFLTYDSWLKLKEKIDEKQNNEVPQDLNPEELNPKEYNDIKEFEI